MKKTNYQKSELFSSFMIPGAYFQTSLLIIEELMKNSSEMTYARKEGHGPVEFKYYMIDPLIYNLKHGVELYCKTVLNFHKVKFIKSHNIAQLFQDCLSCIKKLHISDTELSTWMVGFVNKIYDNDPENQRNRYPNDTSILCYKNMVNGDILKGNEMGDVNAEDVLLNKKHKILLDTVFGTQTLGEDKIAYWDKIKESIQKAYDFFQKIVSSFSIPSDLL